MSFLQPILLAALPLALLPVIIHLIHLHRRRTVPWAAMMFLAAAQKMNRGYSRLRRWLILAFRVIAILAIILTAARPLAGGWLGLTGGAPDTAIVLLDRSASMEQQNLATGLSKREAGLKKLSDGIREAYRGRSRLVLIDSATGVPQEVEKPEALADLPATWATDTTADIPGLMQAALDYISTNQTGRTDIWVLSDLQQADWDASGGRWEPLRQGFAELQGVRFHLLSYPQEPEDNLAVTVSRALRRESRDKTEVVLDLDIARSISGGADIAELPVRFVIDGTASVLKAELRDDRLSLSGHAIPIDKSQRRGWGRVELPADSRAPDNVWHFVYDETPVLSSTIVTDDPEAMAPVAAALGAPADPDRKYAVTVLSPDRVAEIKWEETALVVWHAPIPSADDLAARQLADHAAAGRSLLFLPPDNPGTDSFQGVAWGEWRTIGDSAKPDLVSWWRNDTGPLANTRDGASLPVGEVEITGYRSLAFADGQAAPLPLARLKEAEPLLVQAGLAESGSAAARRESVYFLGTLPGTEASSLARDGVVLYAFLHRVLDAASGSLGSARQREAGAGSLGPQSTDAASAWKRGGGAPEDVENGSVLLPLRAGILENGERLLALNRPADEDIPKSLVTATLDGLFQGLDYRIIEDTLQDENSLASEIWRTFLMLMAAALILEALLSMPPRRAAPLPSQATTSPSVA
jgi:hypothetical protein